MNAKTILITGGTGGIGKAVAIELAKQSHEIIITGRDLNSAEQAKLEIQQISNNEKVSFLLADMSSFKEISNLCASFKSKFDKLDVLINNVGVFAHKRELSNDGIELNFAINTLAPYVLFKQLSPLLFATKGARVVNVMTQNHAMVNKRLLNDFQSESQYIGLIEYGKTKLYNLWWLYNLASLYSEKEILFFGADPGASNTKLMEYEMSEGKSWPLAMRILRPIMIPVMKKMLRNKNLSTSAKSVVFAATSADLNGKTGLYINEMGVIDKSSKLSYDKEKQREMGTFIDKMYDSLFIK
jgi:retinol dehydrogenase 14